MEIKLFQIVFKIVSNISIIIEMTSIHVLNFKDAIIMKSSKESLCTNIHPLGTIYRDIAVKFIRNSFSVCAAQWGYNSRLTAVKGSIKSEGLRMVQDPCDPENCGCALGISPSISYIAFNLPSY